MSYRCPKCSSPGVIENNPDKGFVQGFCPQCGEGWIRRADRVCEDIVMVDDIGCPVYRSLQEEEPERRERPVLKGKAYHTLRGIVYTMDLSPKGQPKDASATDSWKASADGAGTCTCAGRTGLSKRLTSKRLTAA